MASEPFKRQMITNWLQKKEKKIQKILFFQKHLAFDESMKYFEIAFWRHLLIQAQLAQKVAILFALDTAVKQLIFKSWVSKMLTSESVLHYKSYFFAEGNHKQLHGLGGSLVTCMPRLSITLWCW